jgi:hypothetical protein
MNNSYNSNSSRNNEVIRHLSLSPKKTEQDSKNSKNDEIQDDESEKEEDEETKKQRKREEYTNFLIKLLTETDTPKRKIMKKGFKLNPISLSKTSLDRSTSVKSLATQESNSNIKKKYFTPKEPKKKKLLKGSENKEKKVNKKNIILNEIKLKQSKRKQFFHKNLDKLYGYNKKFLFYNAKLKKQKWNNLEKYQDDILRVSAINTSKDYMMKLSSDLKTIRINSEQTKPLPPINFRALVHHSLDQNKRKKIYGIKANNRNINQMDEYEKEMYDIKTSFRHRRLNLNTNKFIYKMYEILPEHVVDTLYIKKGKH